jgi:predicted PurR-regulated permease PerM
MRKSVILSIRSDKRFSIAFIILFVAVLFAILYIFRYFFWPLLFALVFYVSLKPFHDFLHGYIRKRWIVTLLVITLFVLLIIIPFLFLLIALADQTLEFYQLLSQKMFLSGFQDYLFSDERVRTVLKVLQVSRTELVQKIMLMLQNTSFDLFSSIKNLVGVSLNFVVNFFFMILMLFAIFTEGKRLGEFVYNIIPFPREIEKSIVRRLRDVIKVLIAGNIAIMFLQGLALGVGFYIFGTGVPILAGCISGIFSLIPVVGTSFVWLPAVIYYIATGNYMTAALLGVWCVSWYLFLENFVKPKFFGSRLDFHPLVFFFLLIGSIGVFNLPGIIVGPILLTIFFSLWEIYSFLYLEDPEPIEKESTEVKKGSRRFKTN